MADPFEQIWDTPEKIEEASKSKQLPGDNYPTSLPHDLACCVADEEVEALRLKYEMTPAQFEYILERHDFKREFSEWRQRLISEGNSFKLKLRAMAEEYLPRLHQLMHSELTTPSIKVDAFKYITKVAGLEPKKEEEQNQDSGPKIIIKIANFASPDSAKTIEVTPRELPELPEVE